MEQPAEKSIFDDFTIDDEAKQNFAEISRWANLNAIVGFIALGITVVSTVINFVKLSSYGSGAATAGIAGGSVGLVISVVISLLLNIILLQAAANIKKGVIDNDQGFFGIGLRKLATYFKALGILIIIGLVIFVLAFLFVLLLSAGRGF